MPSAITKLNRNSRETFCGWAHRCVTVPPSADSRTSESSPCTETAENSGLTGSTSSAKPVAAVAVHSQVKRLRRFDITPVQIVLGQQQVGLTRCLLDARNGNDYGADAQGAVGLVRAGHRRTRQQRNRMPDFSQKAGSPE